MNRYLFSLFFIMSASTSAFAEKTYVGHGAETTSAETLKQFAPPALPSDLSRKIQLLLDVRSPGIGMLSEDGKQLAFSWAVTGTRQIWKMSAPLRYPLQMTGGEDNTALNAWTPDGKYLILSRDRKGEEYPGLYLQSTNGGELLKIQHEPKVQTIFSFVSADSKYIYFRANDIKPESYAIYRYSIEKKTKELLFSQDGFWTVMDHKEDGNWLLAKVKGNFSNEVYLWNMHRKVLEPLAGIGEDEEFDMRFAHKSGEYLLMTNKYSDFRRLYIFKSQNSTPTAISPELPMDVSSYSIDTMHTRILYTVNDKGYTRVRAMDAKTFKEIAIPSLPDADQMIFGETTRNSQFTIFAVASAKHPLTSYIYEWKKKKLTQWVLPSSPEVSTENFVIPRLEEYPARDGSKIPMFVYTSTNCKKPCPVIVDFHGGPEAQAQPGFSLITQFLVAEGFTYVMPNVRGSDGYGKNGLIATMVQNVSM